MAPAIARPVELARNLRRVQGASVSDVVAASLSFSFVRELFSGCRLRVMVERFPRSNKGAAGF